MSFDAHSLERLKELGRSLPQALPKPVQPTDIASQASEGTRASERRHRVETEENPEALFHELMRVSPDGTVPPHLMDRLKKAEGQQAPARTVAAKPGKKAPLGDGDLYTAFQQLLLEDDDLGANS